LTLANTGRPLKEGYYDYGQGSVKVPS
jgi:hypothetical protein